MKSNTKEATPEDIEYYKQVIEHCQYNGIIREEHSFKSDKLKRYDLQYYGITKLKHLTNHHTLTTLEKLIETLEVSTMDYTSIAQQLLDSGVCRSRQSANSTQSVALEWMNDVDFNRKTPKNTQFYEHKRRLLSICLDISIPFRTDRNVLPMIRNQREIVRYSHDTIPAWYRAPKTQIQQLKIA